MGKQKAVRAHDGYSVALPGKESLARAAAWVNLEDVMLSEVSQPQKYTCCMTTLHEGPKIVKTFFRGVITLAITFRQSILS